MSFILDALKKAERERDLSRVPTLSTVHVPVEVTGRQIAIWLAAGVLLVGGGLSIWLLRPASVTPPAVTDSRTQGGSTLHASAQESPRTSAPMQAISAPPPALAAPVAPGPSGTQQQVALRQPNLGPASNLRPAQTSSKPSGGSETVVAASGGRGGGGRQGDMRPGAPPAEEPPPDQSAPALQPPPVVQPPPAVQPPPIYTTPAPVVPAPVPGQPPPFPQAAPGPQVTPPPAVVAPRPSAASTNPPTLVDAMAKMKLDLFVYTDVPTDRMVIINGRKYVEGEQVDGLYLITQITKDGALLSYQGEKLLLRP